MKFKDLLKDQGFLPVAMPTDDFELLQILVDDGGEYLKHLPDKLPALFLRGEEGALPVGKSSKVANFKGTAITKFNTKLSIKFLEDLLKKLGIELGFGLDISKEKELIFVFEAPQKETISSLINLNKYLNGSKVEEGPFGKMLKGGDIYVTTSLLKSSKFAVAIVKKSKLDANLDLPSIKDLVEAKLALDSDNQKQSCFEYDGDTPLTFAIQAIRIRYDRTLGQWLFGKKGVFSAIDSVQGRVVRDDEDIPVVLLNVDQVLWENTEYPHG